MPVRVHTSLFRLGLTMWDWAILVRWHGVWHVLAGRQNKRTVVERINDYTAA